MKRTDFELTDLEVACGVTVLAVHDAARKTACQRGQVWVPFDVSPVLGGAAARYRLGKPAEYIGKNLLGITVFEAAP